MEDIVALCKRVIIINHGKIIYDGIIKELIDKYAPHKVLKITFEKNIRKLYLEKYGKIISSNGDIFEIEVLRDKTTRVAAEILNKFPVDDILIDEPEAREIIRMIFNKGKA